MIQRSILPLVILTLCLHTLQEDINMCVELSLSCQLPFNTSKCKLLHLDQFNIKHCYMMGDIDIEIVREEKDLGVIIDTELQFHAQC